MILHFLIHSQGTEKQFASYVMRQFSAPEMKSEFVVLSSNEAIVDYKDFDNVKVVNPDSRDRWRMFMNSLSRYSAIVLHGMFAPWVESLLREVPSHVKVAWVFWGGELYGRRDVVKQFLAHRTKMVYLKKELLNTLRGKSKSQYEVPVDCFKRVDYCLTDVEEEYEFAKSYLRVPNMQYHWYNYYSIEETVCDLQGEHCQGDSVFVGNSATVECNYFDVLPILAKTLPLGMKTIVPLSYGSSWIKRRVVQYGHNVLGERFVPLIEFMPRDEYNRLLLSCGVMIQPHYRPQAQGNIITGLWLGMRVYLSERNMAYHFFKRLGTTIFSIEHDLKRDALNAFPILTGEVVDNNRRILSKWYGQDAMRERIHDLVNLLDG